MKNCISLIPFLYHRPKKEIKLEKYVVTKKYIVQYIGH